MRPPAAFPSRCALMAERKDGAVIIVASVITGQTLVVDGGGLIGGGEPLL